VQLLRVGAAARFCQRTAWREGSNVDDLKRLEAEVFALDRVADSERPGTLAFLSLRIALRSYFRTYEAMGRQLLPFTQPEILEPRWRDSAHTPEFVEACAEVVVHFQHFVELVCKDVLRALHPLLPTVAPDDPVLFLRALRQEPMDAADAARIKTVEFKSALDRFCALLRAGKIDTTRYGFLEENRALLNLLNNLRNRIWHRGAYVLRYPALDELVTRHLLPLAVKISELPEYQECLWRPRDLSCGVDPIDALIESGRIAPINTRRLALLKELGRAAYENPLRSSFLALEDQPARGKDAWFFVQDRQYIRRTSKIALQHLGENGAAEVKKCPVCSVQALIVYHDHDVQDFDAELNTATVVKFAWEVRCICCTFSITFGVGKLRSSPILITQFAAS